MLPRTRRSKNSQVHKFLKGNRGIPEKCEAILSMKNLSNVKKIQCLNEKLVTLSRFMPRLAKKVKPFFKLDEACWVAFSEYQKKCCFPHSIHNLIAHSTITLYLFVSNLVQNSIFVYKDKMHHLICLFH